LAAVTFAPKLAKLARTAERGSGMARPRITFRSLRVTPEFGDFVLDQLARVPQLRSKRMFGGIGLYSGEAFFGILAADELFFKVDDTNRSAYQAAGTEPFRPVANRPVTMSYWRVPLEVLEDPGELASWALAAIRAAGNATAERRRSGKRSRKRAARKKPARKASGRKKGRRSR
jgi:DNA transformation protein